jgi:hypothetical protein
MKGQNTIKLKVTEFMEELVDVSKSSIPLFVDRMRLSEEQLKDPDYALKELEKLNKGRYSVTCSKCHHCR